MAQNKLNEMLNIEILWFRVTTTENHQNDDYNKIIIIGSAIILKSSQI